MILAKAYRLKQKPQYGINRDYPNEIVQARGKILAEFKKAKGENAGRSVFIAYPAKLVVNKRVVRDEFPDWNSVLRMSQTRSHYQEQNTHVTESLVSEAVQKRADMLAPSDTDESTTEVSDTPPDEYSQAMAVMESRM